jgi:hypothetical protein
VNGQPKSFLHRLGHWSTELVLVFLGAYAAFWLTNYQQHHADARRHDQLLAALEEEVTEAIDSATVESAKEAENAAEFRRGLAVGEMPPVTPFNFKSDYSATDMATLLQSGGFELLDIKTLIAIRKVESTLRGGLTEIQHFQKLSDELIWPNLDQETSFFYDPATKQLRKRFATDPEALDSVVQFFGEYIRNENNLLTQIRAERQRH